MNFAQAKAIPIAEILAKVDIKPVKENSTDAMFPAPWRAERTASLHVSKEANVWYDHGEGFGGTAYDLVVHLLKFRGYKPSGEEITLVIENFKTHPASAFYETFKPVEAKRLWDRFEFV